MISVRKCGAAWLAAVLAFAAPSAARAQTGDAAIYGVTTVDVAPTWSVTLSVRDSPTSTFWAARRDCVKPVAATVRS